MDAPYVSEIRLFAFGFAPKGWAFCNGQLLSIQQNQALFSLLGTTYGGDGMRTFGLPNLQGRVPVHYGQGIALGASGGEESHTLLATEMPTHTHPATADGTAASGSSKFVANSLLGTLPAGVTYYGPPANPTPMSPTMVTNAGGNQAHPNMQPYTVMNACIALVGIYPSRS
jgi:microcystin-dependent protein